MSQNTENKVHDGAKPKGFSANACHASQNMLYLLVIDESSAGQIASACWSAALPEHFLKSQAKSCR